jgi:hypothetical protein
MHTGFSYRTLGFHDIYSPLRLYALLYIEVPALVFRRFNLSAYFLLVLETDSDSAEAALVFDPLASDPCA